MIFFDTTYLKCWSNFAADCSTRQIVQLLDQVRTVLSVAFIAFNQQNKWLGIIRKVVLSSVYQSGY